MTTAKTLRQQYAYETLLVQFLLSTIQNCFAQSEENIAPFTVAIRL